MTQPTGPIDISGEEFIEPTPEWAIAFSETFAEARARVAREEAETEGSVSNMEPLESTEALEGNPVCPPHAGLPCKKSYTVCPMPKRLIQEST